MSAVEVEGSSTCSGSSLEMTLTADREGFVQGLFKLGVPLRKVQLDELFDILDVDEDGVVRFQEFVAMKQQTKESCD